MDNSRIEWTDATWNPIAAIDKATGRRGWFCVHASEGCRFCYAESMNRWVGTGHEYAQGNLKKVELQLVYNARSQASMDWPVRAARPRKIFVCSMTDLFANFIPEEFVIKIFQIMVACSQHTFIVLTKRPERMSRFLDREFPDGLPRQIWIGISAEDQGNYDLRIPYLKECPAAAVKFVSLEPLLGRIELGASVEFLNWVIVGGESGRLARPMHAEWAVSLQFEAWSCGIPVFFKQWGEWLHLSQVVQLVTLDSAHLTSARIHDWPDQSKSLRVGKEAAGSDLFGIPVKQFPEG